MAKLKSQMAEVEVRWPSAFLSFPKIGNKAMMRTLIGFLLLVLLTCPHHDVKAFAPGGARLSTSSRSSQLAQSAEVSQEEVGEMTDLILSISLEPTDESRRERVVKLFEEELAKPNGAPARFAALFDQVLMVVGERIQNDAKNRAMEAQSTEQAVAEAKKEEGEEAKKEDFMDKPPQERQIWALIDLMVQSKMIVKKHNTNLGEGAFD